MITELKPNQVFVFGSNLQGFHGAGAAGFAFSGTTANDWRACPKKQAAIAAFKCGIRIVGKWAVWGNGRGLQVGLEGSGYAIPTKHTPNGPRLSVGYIEDEIAAFIRFAKARPDLEFLVTAIGTGYAGYSIEEMGLCWAHAEDWAGEIPANVKFVR